MTFWIVEYRSNRKWRQRPAVSDFSGHIEAPTIRKALDKLSQAYGAEIEWHRLRPATFCETEHITRTLSENDQ